MSVCVLSAVESRRSTVQPLRGAVQIECDFSACGGASSCSVTSDLSGDTATWLTPGCIRVATITATLAPGVYKLLAFGKRHPERHRIRHLTLASPHRFFGLHKALA